MYTFGNSITEGRYAINGIAKMRELTEELAEDIAALREKISRKKSMSAAETESAQADESHVIIVSKNQGMIHHLKNTRNSISLN